MNLDYLKQTIEPILNSPKVSVIVPFLTAIASTLQGVIAFISMCVGMFISLLILRHWWITNIISQIRLDKLIADRDKNEDHGN